MKYVIIDPKARTIETVNTGDKVDDLKAVIRRAGLDPSAVDHGSMGRRIGYVVFEYGMFTPAAEQNYFAIGAKLIAGPCVLYGVGAMGETVDLMKSQITDVRFYLGANDVEAAIEREEIYRPQMSTDGNIIWQWPQPRPASLL